MDYSPKERVSLSIEPELLCQFDDLVAQAGANRSEAMRDLIRNHLSELQLSNSPEQEAVATLTLVYDHNKKDVSDRLITIGHDNHASILASMHVHLDHDQCLEIIALRGKATDLITLGEKLRAVKGVKLSRIIITPTLPIHP